MDDTPADFRIDESSRLIAPSPDQAERCGWLAGMRSEEVGKGWRINQFDFLPPEDLPLTISGPPTFSISLFIDGRGRLALDRGPALDVRPGMLVLFHAPRPTRGLNHVYGGNRVLGIDFRFAPEVMVEVGGQCLAPLLRGFSEDCSVQDALLLGRPLTAALRRIATDVIGCALAGAARRLFLEAKALELLAYIVAATGETEAPAAPLSRRDRERVQLAARLLSERYSEPWTIARLARAAGLNERKLKTGFRALIGQTVHAHLEAARLEAARNLLADGAADVTETALAVGYANPSHFAKRFRQRMGLSPSTWRRLYAGAQAPR